jgi:hypothetical protein
VSSGPKIEIDDSRSRKQHRTPIEMLAVVLLGIATVATAWCGFQSSRWNGQETDHARAATLSRVESSRLYNVAVQKVAYDANVTAQYAAAVSAGNDKLVALLRQNLVRPAFLPFLDQWSAQVKAGETVPNLFDNQQYLAEQFVDSAAETAKGDAELVLSGDAADNSDGYVAATLLTATALFFAGVTTSFGTRSARIALLMLAMIVLVYVSMRLANLPVA